MSRISIKAILVGGFVDVVSSFVLAIPIAMIAASRGADATKNSAYVTLGMLVGLACSVFGGYVAGKIAKHNQLLNGVLSSWLCTALGICSLIFGVAHQSHSLEAFGFISSPICALLGGYFARPRMNRELA